MRYRSVLGFVTGILLLSACQEASPGPDPEGSADAEIDVLRRELALERKLRAALAAELVAQRALAEETAAIAAARSPEAGEENAAEPANKGKTEGTAPAEKGRPRPWFNADSLLIRGIPLHEVERIHEYFGASQMEQIELQHQAMREGWFKTGRYQEARKQLEADFRAKIGEEDYDLLLYGTGKRNRVVVADVVERSPGSRAGFQLGDTIIRYDDTRIFRGSEMQRLSTDGKLGESVPVDVLRNGEIVRLYIDRGPMGFGLEHRHMWPYHLR